MKSFAIGLLTALLFLTQTALATSAIGSAGTQVQLVSENQGYRAGQTQWIAVDFQLKPGWHTYWINAGASGAPANATFTTPEGVLVGGPRWPSPTRKQFAGLNVYGYEDRLLLMYPLQVPWGYTGDLTLSASLNWLACKDVCIPEFGEVSMTLSPADGPSQWAKSFAKTRAKLPSEQALSAVWDIQGRLQVLLPDGFGERFGERSAWTFFPFSNRHWPAEQYQESYPQDDGLVFEGAASEGAPAGIVVHLNSGQSWPVLPEIGQVAPVSNPLLTMLLFAFVGGVILNLMPCVFPILSIKALGLANSASYTRAVRWRKGLLFTLGVVCSFWLLAAVLIGLQMLGAQIGWGFQLQSTPFVALMAVLMLLVAANLLGWFEFSMRWAGIGQNLTRGQGDRADFFTGVLAVVVASPCTAPFMGPAMGYALSAPAVTTLAVFTALGLGLAAPMLALYVSSAVAKRLPRPGPWMNHFKQALAFPMLLTAGWLLWVGARQLGWGFDFVWMIVAVAFGFMVWLQLTFKRVVYSGLALTLVLGLAGHSLWQANQPQLVWQAYSASSLSALRQQDRPVLVNMTADWCISCLANEQWVFAQPDLAGWDVAWVKGDWTDYDPRITQYLNQYNRVGVPLYVVYRPGQPPQVLPQVLTLDMVRQALF